MNKRYLGALFISPLLIFLLVGGIYLKYVVMILSLLGLFEYHTALRKRNISTLLLFNCVLCILYYVFLKNSLNYNFVFNIITAAVFLLLCIVVLSKKYNFIDIGTTILGFIYIPVFFSFIVIVNQKLYGNYMVWLIFISAWLCDTFAYYTGKLFGKRKLCPKVSPKKTVEGSIGGTLGSIISCGIFGIILRYCGVNIPLPHFFAIGALCGIFSQFGDLAASSLKRYVGIKDYSNLIPGHGGILDRFDSILFTSFVVYYYITFILRM